MLLGINDSDWVLYVRSIFLSLHTPENCSKTGERDLQHAYSTWTCEKHYVPLTTVVTKVTYKARLQSAEESQKAQ